MLRRIVLANAILLALTASSIPGGEPDEKGFTPLFDGKTLAGWHVMNNAKFVAEDGVIKLNGGGGWLRSDKQYADFVLRLQLRFLKPKQDGGVFLRASLDGKNWPAKRYEVQSENSPRMAKLFGAKYEQDVDLTQKSLKPTGEWNDYEITVVGPKLEVRLNGQLVTRSDNLANTAPGYIGLQGENGWHEYRNLRIRELPRP